MLLDTHIVESGRAALAGESLRLLIRPAMAGETGSAGTHAPFDCQQPPSRSQHSAGLGESGIDVLPVMHGCHAPQDSRGRIRLPEVFGRALGPRNASLLVS
jgi:hypothetical protein